MVDSESGHCVRVEQHVYPQTVNLMILHYKKSLAPSGHYHQLIEMYPIRGMILVKNYSIGVKQQSLTQFISR